jgi:hypothetical protein
MKKYLIILPLILGYFVYGSGNVNKNLINRVKFASAEKAKELLLTEDQFTKDLSQFDINSRLQKNKSTKMELMEFISAQALDWTQEEKDRITLIIKDIDSIVSVNGYKLKLPDEIYLIKSTTKEEGGVRGYSRSNYIVLKDLVILMPEFNLKEKILQELFHIMMRYDRDFKIKMYKIIGFNIMNEISSPEAIRDRIISYPDAPQNDSYITLLKDGKPVDCSMIIYSMTNYMGGFTTQYQNFGFLKLKDPSSGEIDTVEGKPLIYSIKDVTNFMEQVGKNTKFLFNPEVILADNFVFAIINKKGLTSQWVIEKIQATLKE